MVFGSTQEWWQWWSLPVFSRRPRAQDLRLRVRRRMRVMSYQNDIFPILPILWAPKSSIIRLATVHSYVQRAMPGDMWMPVAIHSARLNGRV